MPQRVATLEVFHPHPQLRLEPLRLPPYPLRHRRALAILKLLKRGQSWSSIVDTTGCSRATLSKLAKRLVH